MAEPRSLGTDAVPDEPNRERDPGKDNGAGGSRPEHRSDLCPGLQSLKFGCQRGPEWHLLVFACLALLSGADCLDVTLARALTAAYSRFIPKGMS